MNKADWDEIHRRGHRRRAGRCEECGVWLPTPESGLPGPAWVWVACGVVTLLTIVGVSDAREFAMLVFGIGGGLELISRLRMRARARYRGGWVAAGPQPVLDAYRTLGYAPLHPDREVREWVGPCPNCGGHFHVRDDGDKGAHLGCRGCGRFLAIVAALGIEGDSAQATWRLLREDMGWSLLSIVFVVIFVTIMAAMGLALYRFLG